MSRKVTVTVSIDSDIMFRIDNLKSKGNELNVSHVCNNALAEWVYSRSVELNRQALAKVEDNGIKDTVSESTE